MAEASESLNCLRILLLAPGKQASLAGTLDINPKTFLVCNTRCPAEQLAQIVTVRHDVKLFELVFVLMEIVDCCEYRCERGHRPAHAVGILVYEDHTRVSGNTRRVGISPDVWCTCRSDFISRVDIRSLIFI
jgi:hypothetical protein